MPKKSHRTPSKATVPTQDPPVESQRSPAVVVGELEPDPAAQKKKSYYNPITAKAYRERIKAAAIAGGYVPKPKGEGTGKTVKKQSAKGTTYYYQPWSSLTEEQKKARLQQARVRAADEREAARRYRAEHPEQFSKKEQKGDVK